jgi:putative two-component system response regulator
VDDEEANRELLEDLLDTLGHQHVTAENGTDALLKLTPQTDLVLLDVMMPGMNGFEVAERIRQDPPYADLPIIMVTALSSKEDRLRAVRAGANDFIGKPVERTELEVRTASLLELKRSKDALKRNQIELEQIVEERTTQLRESLQYLAESQRSTYTAYLDTIRRLALASEYKDACTGMHLTRVAHYCALLGRALQLPDQLVEVLFHASMMHDVGKLAIPDAIILKPGSLTPEERRIMQDHTTIGARILAGSESELLRAGHLIACSHHEKWDGTGYPHGLKGGDIPIFGRICAVADVFDALTTHRSYKRAFSIGEACDVLRTGRGTHFDPNLVDHFLAHIDGVCAVYRQYADGNDAMAEQCAA